MAEGAQDMTSAAWLYKPMGSKMGFLRLTDGQLTLTLMDEKVVFDTPLEQVEVVGWPSYGVAPDSQVKLKADGKKYRVCFVAPSNAKEVQSDGELETIGSVGAAMANARRALSTYPAGMKIGAIWHELLDPARANALTTD
jgi:hypothetical protein